MHILYTISFIILCIFTGQYSAPYVDTKEVDKFIFERMKNLDRVEPAIELIRITDTKEKGTLPLKGYYDASTTRDLDLQLKSSYYVPLPALRVTLSEAATLFDSSWYSPAVPSIMILHDKCPRKMDTERILRAFWLRAIDHNFNIFVWDMPGYLCNKVDTLLSSVFNYDTDYTLGLKKITHFFETGMEKRKISPEQINLIGLGISAHLAAEIAITLNVQVGSIVGLDPPLNEPLPDITTNHAYHLHMLYTNKDAANTVVSKEGSGRVDFIFTYERITAKDPCEDKDPIKCNHDLCAELFVGAILVAPRFEAWKCDSLSSFQIEEEHCNKDITFITYPPQYTPEGRYFLRVKTVFPFGVGADGRRFDFNSVLYNEHDEEGLNVVYDPRLYTYMTPEKLKEHDHLFHRREEKRLEPGDPYYYLQWNRDIKKSLIKSEIKIVIDRSSFGKDGSCFDMPRNALLNQCP